MDFKLEREFSKAEILQEVDALKKQIDDARPLQKDIEDRVMQKLRLEWNYNSNAIEGNKLNYGETVALLMHGITAKGKPLKDHLDIQGHDEGINFLLSIIKESRSLSEADIRALHKMILVEPYTVSAQTAEGKQSKKIIKLGEYKTSPNHVMTITGEVHYYATPEETPAKMQDLMEWYNQISNDADVHPVVVAALFHHKFVAIHPFDDGNGRVSRILMNLILMRNHYPPAIIRNDDKQNYYALLSQADVGEALPFIEYIADRLTTSLQFYLKAINGEDIDEDEDIDKEIALLKIRLNGGVVAKEKRSQENIERVFFDSIMPLVTKIVEKARNFDEFFFNNNNSLDIEFEANKQKQFNRVSIFFADKSTYAALLKKGGQQVRFNQNFNQYKDPQNMFNITILFTFVFDQFYYRIFLRENEILSKLYHEKISPNEQSKILRYFVQDFTGQINEKLKSPESN